jgi:hypothetical protein
MYSRTFEVHSNILSIKTFDEPYTLELEMMRLTRLWRLPCTKSAADRLPPLLHTILSSPRIAIGGILILCSALDLIIILPFYLASLLLTEIGLYICLLAFIWCMGRVILRLLTFPASTHRVQHDIQLEFTKYSIRLLDHCLDSCLDLASALDRLGKHSPISRKDIHEWIPLARKTFLYRNRVFAVYVSVLSLLFEKNSSSQLHGNNPLDLNPTCIDTESIHISPMALAQGKQLYLLLQQLLVCLQDVEREVGSMGIPSRSIHLQTKGSLLSSTANQIKQHLLLVHSISGPHNTPDHSNLVEGGTKQDDLTWIQRGNQLLTLITHHIDPPPYSSIFNLDVLRGCFLSRYKNSRQVWIPRPVGTGGGMIDAIHIPSTQECINKKAVMYCNPNAGVMELVAGMTLFGGNVDKGREKDECDEQHNWVDFYLDKGFDVYIFNYSGYVFMKQNRFIVFRSILTPFLFIFPFTFTTWIRLQIREKLLWNTHLQSSIIQMV